MQKYDIDRNDFNDIICDNFMKMIFEIVITLIY